MNTNLTDIKDIHPPLEFATPFPWGWLALGVIFLLGGAALLFYILRQRNKPRLRTPHELARSALDSLQLEAEILEDAEYARKLSLIVRYYVHEAFEIRALEMTEPQFFREVGRRFSSQGIETETLNSFAHLCEQTKFGRVVLSPKEREMLKNNAYSLLDNLQKLILIRDARI